jgi:hypothetical protein
MSTVDTFFVVDCSTDDERRITVNRTRNILRSRLIPLLALLAIVAVSLAGPSQPAAVAACPDAANVRYYSDATYTTQVGYCFHDCCRLWTCTGQLTDYYIVRKRSCSVE